MTSTWLLPAFLIFGLFGLYTWSIGRLAFSGSPGIQGLFRFPWLGYGLLLAVLQITHIFLPLDHRFSVRCLFLGTVFVVLLHLARAAWRGVTPRSLTKGWPGLVPLFLIAFVTFIPVFNASTKPACHYDLGLYYLQEIRWMETFPIVPGLGNLLLNLGFNQSAFLVTSFVDGLLPDRIGLWLAGGLLPWLGLTLSAYALLRLIVARKAQRSPLEIGYAISFPAWIYVLMGNNISSGSPDVASSCLLIHLFLAFAALIMTADSLGRARLCGDVWLLGAVCICVKLNTLGMVIGIWGGAVLFLILEKDISQIRRTEAMYGAAIAACLLGFWVYRGVLLTGYPLFPSRAISARVAWQVEANEADQCRKDTISWARLPWGDQNVALDGLSWIGPWTKRVISLDIQFNWPIGIGLTGSAALLLLAWMERRLRRSSYFLMLLCVPLLLHTVFWISTAPEPRYFGATPWLFATAPILGLIAAQPSLALLSALTYLYLCAVPMAGLIMETSWQWATPDPKFPEIPRSNMAAHTNRVGLSYYAPVEGNQSFDNALPSSNRRLDNIGLLNPEAGISGGFRSVNDGELIRLGEKE